MAIPAITHRSSRAEPNWAFPAFSGADRENPRPAASHHDLRTDFRPWHLSDLMFFWNIYKTGFHDSLNLSQISWRFNGRIEFSVG